VSRTARRTVRRLVALAFVVVVAVALVAIRVDARLFSPRASPTMPLFHRKLKARWSWPPCAECTTLDRLSTYAEQPLMTQ
jgi:integral membrane sensor domain MASE1